MRSLELFAGTGALALAIENTLGATTDYVAEFEEAPSKVLAHHFPGAHNLHDVTTAAWDALGTIDVIGGGSPCQDISGAGRRAGMIRGNRSGLWESYREAVATLRPKFVVWENVRGALTSKASSATDPDGKAGNLRALGRVLGDLASLGYDAEWVMVKASDVGGCHQRARIFLLAWDRYTVSAIHPGAEPFAVWDEGADQFRRPAEGLFAVFADTYRDKFPTAGAMRSGDLLPRHEVISTWPDIPLLRTPCAAEAGGGPLSPTQAKAQGRTLRLTGQILELFHPGILDNNPKLLPTTGANLGTNDGPQDPDKRRAGGHSVSIEDVAAFRLTGTQPIKLLPTPRGLDSTGVRGRTNNRTAEANARAGATLGDVAWFDTWGEYLPAVLRHALVFGADVPAPTEPGSRAGSRVRLAAPFPEWMMGYQPGWVTSPELGIKRGDQLKMIGNGVMQQQAEHGINECLARAGIGEVASHNVTPLSHVA